MSLINEYRNIEESIKELQERLKNMSQDDKLQKELEFEGKLPLLGPVVKAGLGQAISRGLNKLKL